MNKYKNIKVIQELAGVKRTFASKAEHQRYLYLENLERLGLIKNLELQPKFQLLDSFERHGEKHRPLRYIADFRYIENMKIIVEDVNGVATKDYLIKRKLFLFQHEMIIFREVRLITRRWSVTEL